MYQVSSVKFQLRSIPSVVRTIVEQEGFHALWRGNTATMLRVFPYAGIQFMTFDYCKKIILKQRSIDDGKGIDYNSPDHSHHKHGLMPMESLVAGSIAGMLPQFRSLSS